MSLFKKQDIEKVIKHVETKSLFKRYWNFLLGCLLVAIAYNLFLAPNNIVSGGVGGVAIILNGLFGLNNSIVIFVLDVILLIISYFLLGKEQTRATVLGSLLFPLFVELTSGITAWIPIEQSELLLSSVIGGVINGFGLGMIFKAGFTTGGTDILNQIVSKYGKMSLGKSMIFTDGLIVLASAFVFGPTKVMYAVIVLYIISLMSDKVVLGISDSKAFYIITDKDQEIKEYILKVLNHGVTVFNAKGGFAKEKQNVLMCVLPTRDYYRLKAGINEIDSEAFFVVTDAYEVFGGE